MQITAKLSTRRLSSLTIGLVLPQLLPDRVERTLGPAPSLVFSLAHVALDPLHLGLDVFALVRDLVALLLRRPEPWHREPVLEIRPEVVHVANREGQVQAELCASDVR